MRPFLVAIALTATACLLPGEPVERLDLAISLSATQVHADTGVVVRLSATNPHRHTVHLRTTGGCVFGYRLVGPEGADLPFHGLGCRSIVEEVDVAPGETIVRDFWFVPRPDAGGGKAVRRWPAGPYQMIGYLVDEHGDIVKETPPVAFNLVCRDPTWPEC